MALDILDGNSAATQVKTTETAGVHTPHYNVDSSALPSGASTSAKQDSILTALALLATQVTAAAIETAIGAVSTKIDSLLTTSVFQARVPVVGQATIATSIPVAIASNQTTLPVSVANTVTVGSHAVTNAGTFPVQVDSALPAGTNAIGKLAANSGVDIGDVDVTSLPALPAGTNNIGDVDVLTVPADPFGANADVASATGSISAKLRYIASTGIPVTGTVTVGSHAVTNAGTFPVQVDSALPAGTNAIGKLSANSGVDIGDVDVTSVPTDPFGANADVASSSGSISAKLRQIATNGIPISTALPAGTAAIGKLAANSGVDIGDVDVTSVPTDPFGANADAASATGSLSAKLRFIAATGIPVTSLPALAAGTNNIGDVDVLTTPTTSTATHSNVATAATSSVTLLAAATRKGFTIWNDSAVVLYVKYATAAASTSALAAIAAGGFYEDPWGWQGIVCGILASSTGTARVVELS